MSSISRMSCTSAKCFVRQSKSNGLKCHVTHALQLQLSRQSLIENSANASGMNKYVQIVTFESSMVTWAPSGVVLVFSQQFFEFESWYVLLFTLKSMRFNCENALHSIVQLHIGAESGDIGYTYTVNCNTQKHTSNENKVISAILRTYRKIQILFCAHTCRCRTLSARGKACDIESTFQNSLEYFGAMCAWSNIRFPCCSVEFLVDFSDEGILLQQTTWQGLVTATCCIINESFFKLNHLFCFESVQSDQSPPDMCRKFQINVRKRSNINLMMKSFNWRYFIFNKTIFVHNCIFWISVDCSVL